MIELPPVPGAELAPTLVEIDDALDELALRDLEPAIRAIGSLLDRGLPRRSERGDPDGFDGIARDGDLDHLLPSEWLLIGEEPDEFLRRYDRRELSYLRRRTVEPRAAPTSLVVFDTGPEQLGRPRIAHIALLVVLARRADEAGISLSWGTLATHDRRAVTQRTIRELIDARTASTSTDVLHPDLVADDALVVSPSPISASSRLVFAETDDGLDATLVTGRAVSTPTAHIPLPGDDGCIRVLRSSSGPRRNTAGTPRSKTDPSDLRPASNLVFDEQANKVLCRAGTGHSLLLFPSPNSPNDRLGPVRVFDAPTLHPEIVAAGRYRKFALTLQIVENDAFVARQGRTLDWLPEGKVRIVDWSPPERTDQPELGRLWIEDRLVHAEACGQLLVGGADGFVVSGPVTLATNRWSTGSRDVTMTTQPWRITHAGRSFDPRLDGHEVLGCGLRSDLGAGVLAVADDRRTVQFIGEHERATVGYAPAEIADGAVARRRASVAVRTTDDDVVIWDWTTGYELYHWSPP